MKIAKLSAKQNMDLDNSLFLNFNGDFSYRIYSFFSDCITVGYSQNISDFFDEEKCLRFNVEVVKRPTGGGIVFHSREDIIFSAVYPFSFFQNNFKSAYFFTSNIILEALNSCGIPAKRSPLRIKSNPCYCFSSLYDYEIVLNNKKLVGIAQRRTKDRIFLQCAISVSKPSEQLFLLCKDKNEKLQKSSSYLLDFCDDVILKRFTETLPKIFEKRLKKQE